MGYSYSCKLIQPDYIKQNGKSKIMLQVIINRQKSVINTGIEVQPYLFKQNTGKIIPGHNLSKEQAKDLNLILSNEMAKANDVFVRARLQNRVISAKTFKELFLKTTSISKLSFIDFYQTEMELLKKSRRKSTISSYNLTYNKLTSFIEEIMFIELTLSFIDDFDRYLINEGLSQNTRGMHHKNLSTFINIAINRGIDIVTPYKRFRRTRIRGNRDYLSVKELKKLTQLYYEFSLPDNLQETLRMFLFSCYTSLRFSDIETANRNNINNNIYRYTPVKSKNRKQIVKIPLNDTALDLIKEDKGKLFKPITNAAVNRSLKTIAEILGIRKTLTFHVARHTFATTFLSLGGKVEVLKEIMGHSKIETTMIYVHILEEDMINQVANFNTM